MLPQKTFKAGGIRWLPFEKKKKLNGPIVQWAVNIVALRCSCQDWEAWKIMPKYKRRALLYIMCINKHMCLGLLLPKTILFVYYS